MQKLSWIYNSSVTDMLRWLELKIEESLSTKYSGLDAAVLDWPPWLMTTRDRHGVSDVTTSAEYFF